MKGSPAWPRIVFFLTKKPRTVSELVGLTGVHENTVLRAMNELQDEGLISAGKLRGKDQPSRPGTWPQEWSWTP